MAYPRPGRSIAIATMARELWSLQVTGPADGRETTTGLHRPHPSCCLQPRQTRWMALRGGPVATAASREATRSRPAPTLAPSLGIFRRPQTDRPALATQTAGSCGGSVGCKPRHTRVLYTCHGHVRAGLAHASSKARIALRRPVAVTRHGTHHGTSDANPAGAAHKAHDGAHRAHA